MAKREHRKVEMCVRKKGWRVRGAAACKGASAAMEVELQVVLPVVLQVVLKVVMQVVLHVLAARAGGGIV
jgi:hypothetical protein